MAYGGPDSLDDLEPYLLDVRGGRPSSPEALAEMRGRYARIGGRSPLLDITREQARALEQALGDPDVRVFVGMRHWKPYIREAVADILAWGARQVVAICMAPQSSQMSSGAYHDKLKAALLELDGFAPKLDFVPGWHDHPGLIRAYAGKLIAALERFPAPERGSVQVLFTAHSLPSARLGSDDPYDAQVADTARLVASTAGLPETQWQVCYQSIPSGARGWLGPKMEDVVVGLAEVGARNILIVPVGFLADHVEILYDIDIECRELAEARGAHLERTGSLNCSPALIETLRDIVLERLR